MFFRIEFRVRRDAGDVAQQRPARSIELDGLVDGAGQHAVRRGEHQVGCDRGAGAGVSVRADDHH
jgi:hypothetical protein